MGRIWFLSIFLCLPSCSHGKLVSSCSGMLGLALELQWEKNSDIKNHSILLTKKKKTSKGDTHVTWLNWDMTTFLQGWKRFLNLSIIEIYLSKTCHIPPITDFNQFCVNKIFTLVLCAPLTCPSPAALLQAAQVTKHSQTGNRRVWVQASEEIHEQPVTSSGPAGLHDSWQLPQFRECLLRPVLWSCHIHIFPSSLSSLVKLRKSPFKNFRFLGVCSHYKHDDGTPEPGVAIPSCNMIPSSWVSM